MDAWLAETLGNSDKIHISFESPTPNGFRYIGRNHRFVEQLCHRIIANSLDKEKKGEKAARASVFRTDAVETQTTLIQFRVRNVIREVGKQHEMVSEEMFLWGYQLVENGIKALEIEDCKALNQFVIASDLAVNKEQIKSNVLFFDKNSSDDLADKMLFVLNGNTKTVPIDYSINIEEFKKKLVDTFELKK